MIASCSARLSVVLQGARNEAFTPSQRSVSPQRFKRYMGHHPFFDGALNVDPTGAPPPTYHPTPSPAHAAGALSGVAAGTGQATILL
jgi:hypothetical protein